MNNQLKVVIADDSADFIQVLCSYLAERENIQVVGTASDGFELMSMVNAKQPDIVVMDTLLPRKDGLAAIRAMDSNAVKETAGLLHGIFLFQR